MQTVPLSYSLNCIPTSSEELLRKSYGRLVNHQMLTTSSLLNVHSKTINGKLLLGLSLHDMPINTEGVMAVLKWF